MLAANADSTTIRRAEDRQRPFLRCPAAQRSAGKMAANIPGQYRACPDSVYAGLWCRVVNQRGDVTRREDMRMRHRLQCLVNGNEAARARPEYLDTWAAAHAANGDFERAIELQEQALAAAEALEFEGVMDILQTHQDAFRDGQTITETAP